MDMMMKIFKVNWLLVIVVILMVVFVLVEDVFVVKLVLNVFLIVVMVVIEWKLIDWVFIFGMIQLVEEVYVQLFVEGLLIKILKVDVGVKVKVGDVLVMLMDDMLILQKSQLEVNKVKVIVVGVQVEVQCLLVKINLDEVNCQFG